MAVGPYSTDETSILEALAFPARLAILRTLSQQAMNYTELMRSVGMTRQRDAGRFSYHLKKVIAAELVRVNEKSKLYELSKKGHAALSLVSNIKKFLTAADMMIVRRTEATVEPFDKNKIVSVLINEAGVPPRLANRVAGAVEEKLTDLRVDYLTAPLIRELVNSVLIDLGMEKYRHKLTRVGMPVNDVHVMFSEAMRRRDPYYLVRTTSQAVMKEYLLLSTLARHVSDAYLTGLVDLSYLGTWLHGVFGRSYGGSQDVLVSTLEDGPLVDHEISAQLTDSSRREAEKFFSVMTSLRGLRSLSNRLISVFATHEVLPWIPNVRGPNHPSIILSLDEVPTQDSLENTLKDDDGGFSLCFGDALCLSSGYFLPHARTVHGVASVNLPRIAVQSEGDENQFWSKLRESIECLVSCFEKKEEALGRLWVDDDVFQFVVSGVGYPEAISILKGGKGGLELLTEICGRMDRETKRQSRDNIRVMMSSRSPASSAQRMFRLDSSEFGYRRLADLAGVKNETYSTDVFDVLGEKTPAQALEMLVDVIPYFSAGMVIKMRGRRDAWMQAMHLVRQLAAERRGRFLIVAG